MLLELIQATFDGRKGGGELESKNNLKCVFKHYELILNEFARSLQSALNFPVTRKNLHFIASPLAAAIGFHFFFFF